MVTVFPVPGLENGLGDYSDQPSVKCLRSENAEWWRTLRKPQDGRNGLYLRRVACDVRAVDHSSHREDTVANDGTEVFSSGE